MMSWSDSIPNWRRWPSARSSAAVAAAAKLTARLGGGQAGVVLSVNERNPAGQGAYLKAGFADSAQNSLAVPLVSGAATLSYFAEYVATGQATSGAANSSVMYTIAYP